MGSVVSGGMSLAGYAGCCLCSTMTSGCNQAGKASPKAASAIYVVMLFIATAIALLMKNYGQGIAAKIPMWHGCSSDSCTGNESVYRVSFGVVMFFAFSTLIAPFCKAYHTGMWGVKVALLPCAIVGAYFIPSPFYQGFEDWARGVSGIFLVLQVFILLEFAYHLHEYLANLAKEADKGGTPGFCSNRYRVTYLVLCVAFLATSIGGCIAMYSFFGCGFPMFSISVTLVAIVSFTALSMTDLGRGLLVGATISIYVTWLLFSALSSMPEKLVLDNPEICNPIASASNNSIGIWTGIVFAGLSIGYSGWSAATGAFDAITLESAPKPRGASGILADERVYRQLAGEDVSGLGRDGKPLDKSEGSLCPSADVDLETKGADTRAQAHGHGHGEEDEDCMCWKHVMLFHAVMTLCGFYMAMVLTNWADTPDTGDSAVAMSSKTSMWVKFITQYLTMGVYVASLIAPVCCPSRFQNQN